MRGGFLIEHEAPEKNKGRMDANFFKHLSNTYQKELEEGGKIMGACSVTEMMNAPQNQIRNTDIRIIRLKAHKNISINRIREYINRKPITTERKGTFAYKGKETNQTHKEDMK